MTIGDGCIGAEVPTALAIPHLIRYEKWDPATTAVLSLGTCNIASDWTFEQWMATLVDQSSPGSWMPSWNFQCVANKAPAVQAANAIFNTDVSGGSGRGRLRLTRRPLTRQPGAARGRWPVPLMQDARTQCEERTCCGALRAPIVQPLEPRHLRIDEQFSLAEDNSTACGQGIDAATCALWKQVWMVQCGACPAAGTPPGGPSASPQRARNTPQAIADSIPGEPVGPPFFYKNFRAFHEIGQYLYNAYRPQLKAFVTKFVLG